MLSSNLTSHPATSLSSCWAGSVGERIVAPSLDVAFFGLLSVTAFLGFFLAVFFRRSHLKVWGLRGASFFFAFLSCSFRVTLALLDMLTTSQDDDFAQIVHQRFLMAFFVSLGLCFTFIGWQLVALTPYHHHHGGSSFFSFRRICIFFLALSSCLCLGLELLSQFLNSSPGSYVTYQHVHIVWLIMNVFIMTSAIVTVQLATVKKKKNENHHHDGSEISFNRRTIGWLSAVSAAFFVRYVFDSVIVIYFLGTGTNSLTLTMNSILVLCLDVYPLMVFMALSWPRRTLLFSSKPTNNSKIIKNQQQKLGSWIERFFRERGLSASLLVLFYLFVAYLFLDGLRVECEGPFQPGTPQLQWALYVSGASGKVLGQVTPLLLLTVMYGSLTALKSTLLNKAIPFDHHVSLHYHVSMVWVASLSCHVGGAVFFPPEPWFWGTGFAACVTGLTAFVVGALYWLSSRYGTRLKTVLTFPRFIWFHRFGYFMIILLFPMHIWDVLLKSPAKFTLWYVVMFVWLAELVWRGLHLSHSHRLRLVPISEDFFWLEILTRRSNDGAFRAGMWLYMTVPSLSLLERHPFTIALVDDAHSKYVHRFKQLSDDDNDDDAILRESQTESAQLLRDNRPVIDHPKSVLLRFLIKRHNGRGEMSWTNRIFRKLQSHRQLNVFLDGPFSSPAMNLTSRSVKRAILIGVGSGITAPLGIASGLTHCWTTLVFVTRQPEMLAQVVGVVDSICRNQPLALAGGVTIFLTMPHYSWPDERLLNMHPNDAAFGDAYDELQRLARYAFADGHLVPKLDDSDFAHRLAEWRTTHSFDRPLPNVRIHRRGRPDWSAVLSDVVQEASAVEDTMSVLPEMARDDDNMTELAYLREAHLLYTGSVQPLDDIRSWVDANNNALFVEEGRSRLHVYVHTEVWQ